jgi:hypothetical protein
MQGVPDQSYGRSQAERHVKEEQVGYRTPKARLVPYCGSWEDNMFRCDTSSALPYPPSPVLKKRVFFCLFFFPV